MTETEVIELIGGPMDGQVWEVEKNIPTWNVPYRPSPDRDTIFLEYKWTPLKTPEGHRVYKQC